MENRTLELRSLYSQPHAGSKANRRARFASAYAWWRAALAVFLFLQGCSTSTRPIKPPETAARSSNDAIVATLESKSGVIRRGLSVSGKKVHLQHDSRRIGDDLVVEVKIWNLDERRIKAFAPSIDRYRFLFQALSGDQTVPYDPGPPVGLSTPTWEDFVSIPPGAFAGGQYSFTGFYAKAKNFPIRLQVETSVDAELDTRGPLMSEITEIPR